LSDAEKTLKFGDEKFALYMRRQYERATTAFSRLQAEDGADGLCHFVDLSNIFADDPPNLFWDFIHVNNDVQCHNWIRDSRRLGQITLVWSDALSVIPC
jgi:hypothetical protein